MDNKFLKDFIAMRQQIAMKAPEKKKQDAKPSIGGMPVPPSAGLTMAYIIKEKPLRKEVMEYLRERVDQILEEEEGN